ncbi:MAG: DUF4867 family protein [Spirochaetota bacterium]
MKTDPSPTAKAALARLRAANPTLELFAAEAPEFGEFGRLVEGLPTGALVDWMTANVPIGEAVAYQRSVGELEDLVGPEGRAGRDCTWKQYASAVFFGGQAAEVGWVAGKSSQLNAFEYHKSSELFIAATDLVLLLGRLSELRDFARFDSSRVRGFVVGRGTALELYASTLHFAPIMADPSGFRAAIILPLGTNAPLENVDTGLPGEEGLLWAERKWLLACPGSKPAAKGARVGMENVEVKLG